MSFCREWFLYETGAFSTLIDEKMGRIKKENILELTPNQEVVRRILKMFDINVNNNQVKLLYELILLIETKGKDVSLEEIFSIYLNKK